LLPRRNFRRALFLLARCRDPGDQAVGGFSFWRAVRQRGAAGPRRARQAERPFQHLEVKP
jgi:hypothetical protein